MDCLGSIYLGQARSNEEIASAPRVPPHSQQFPAGIRSARCQGTTRLDFLNFEASRSSEIHETSHLRSSTTFRGHFEHVLESYQYCRDRLLVNTHRVGTPIAGPDLKVHELHDRPHCPFDIGSLINTKPQFVPIPQGARHEAARRLVSPPSLEYTFEFRSGLDAVISENESVCSHSAPSVSMAVPKWKPSSSIMT